jgi:hypothetical protein
MPGSFPVGDIVIPPHALGLISASELAAGLIRHARGDWGELDEAHKRDNDRALTEGRRVLSAYRTKAGQRFWVFTEPDRSQTKVIVADTADRPS